MLNEAYRLMFESSPIPGLLTDEEGNVVLANSEAEALFGNGLTGKKLDTLLVPGNGCNDWLAVAPNGKTVPVEVKFSNFTTNDIKYTFASISDVSKNNKLIFDLTERVKEQKTLLQITELVFQAEDPETIFSESVALIGEGWQYPEHTQVCIGFADGQRYCSDGFCETEWKLVSSISLYGQDYGYVTVCYDREFPVNPESGSVFLDEEKRLIEAVAKLFSIFLHQWTAIKKMKDSQELVAKVTALSPVNTYQFEIDETGKIHFLFASRGFSFRDIGYTAEDIMEEPERLLGLIHKDDRPRLDNALIEAHAHRNDINIQYRVVIDDTESWRWLRATCEKNEEGRHVWYGSTQDITQLVAYIDILEEILFDISHVLRKPVSSMLGLTEYLTGHDNLNHSTIKDFAGHLRTVAVEMDDYIRRLNDAYHLKRLSLAIHNLGDFQHLLTLTKKFGR